MNPIEGTREETTRSSLVEDCLGDGTTLERGGHARTKHADSRAGNVDVSVHAGRETWVDDFGGGGGLVDVTVDLFACFHESVAEMGVLVEGVGVSGESEDVFVVAGRELGCGKREDGFEYDLC